MKAVTPKATSLVVITLIKNPSIKSVEIAYVSIWHSQCPLSVYRTYNVSTLSTQYSHPSAKTLQSYKAPLSLYTLGTFSWTTFSTFGVFSAFTTLLILWLICLTRRILVYNIAERLVILPQGLWHSQGAYDSNKGLATATEGLRP